MLLVWGACSGSLLRQEPASDPASSVEVPADSATSTQRLFRIQYAGPEGSGSLRLVLRTQNDGLFQLATVDTLGRALWSLESDSSHTVFVDHRHEVFCKTGEEFRLREVTLEMFSVASIPRLLLGRLPIDLEDGQSDGDSTRYEDDRGRRWSVRREGSKVVAWTLWLAEDPTLWWTSQDKGGILSHRDGSQFRWRMVVEERTTSNLTLLRPPESFRQVPCNEYDLSEFRQDQSAPPGDAPPR